MVESLTAGFHPKHSVPKFIGILPLLVEKSFTLRLAKTMSFKRVSRRRPRPRAGNHLATGQVIGSAENFFYLHGLALLTAIDRLMNTMVTRIHNKI